MLRTIVTTGVLLLTLAGTAAAQTAPATAPLPPPVRAPGMMRSFAGEATFALRGAYHAIADAEARAASSFLDAAKTHYRNAIARFARNDRGAASEALAAAALARAALAERPVPVPRDIPTPPPVAVADGMQPGAVADGMQPMLPRPPGPELRGGPGSPRGRFDANRLAADAKLANTSEARDLAQKALDADIARTRADFSGSEDEAMRQGRLAGALAMAVRSLALADHPPAFMPRPMRPPQGPGQRANATVGMDSDE